MIGTDACWFISFGTMDTLGNDACSGVAIGLSKRIFTLSDVKAIYTPNDPDVIGRLGIVRAKNPNGDLSLAVAYPRSPLRGAVRPGTTAFFDLLVEVLSDRRRVPTRSIPLVFIDSNAHFGLLHDAVTRSWTAILDPCIDPFDAERSDAQGAAFASCLRRAMLTPPEQLVLHW